MRAMWITCHSLPLLQPSGVPIISYVFSQQPGAVMVVMV
jgi:hypothetical protein